MNLFSRIKTATVAVIVALLSFTSIACGIKPDGVVRAPREAEEIFPEVAPSVAVVKSDYNQGTGFVAAVKDNKMFLVTNKHVFEKGASVLSETAELEFFGGRTATGKLIGYDSYHDIAVIAADAFNAGALVPLTFSSDETRYAQRAFIIGNALGRGLGAFDGVISVPDQKLAVTDKKTVPVVQTTVPINSGCSGGPVFDMYGEVLGVGTYQTCKDPIDSERPVDGVSYFVSSFIVEKILYQAIEENGGGSAGAKELFKVDCTLGADGVINFSGLEFSGVVGADGVRVVSSLLVFGNERLEVGDIITHIGNVELAGKGSSFVMSTVMNYLARELMPQTAEWGEIISIRFRRGEITRTIHRQGVYEKKY